MRKFKQFFAVFLSLAALVVLMIGPLYRSLFTYKDCGERHSFNITSPLLIAYIDSIAAIENVETIEQIAELSNKMTSEQLSFQATRSEINPNKLFPNKSTHCVGYSAFYAAVCNYLLSKNGFGDAWHCQAHCGEIHFLGYNVHQLFDSAFFANHDFNIIQGDSDSEIYCTDPTLHDYLGISGVSPYNY
jgi:hypothetical protein